MSGVGGPLPQEEKEGEGSRAGRARGGETPQSPSRDKFFRHRQAAAPGEPLSRSDRETPASSAVNEGGAEASRVASRHWEYAAPSGVMRHRRKCSGEGCCCWASSPGHLTTKMRPVSASGSGSVLGSVSDLAEERRGAKATSEGRSAVPWMESVRSSGESRGNGEGSSAKARVGDADGQVRLERASGKKEGDNTGVVIAGPLFKHERKEGMTREGGVGKKRCERRMKG